MKKPKVSYSELVKKDYPNAVAVNVGTKIGANYYHILTEQNGTYLGQGKSKQAAWTAAYRNIND